MIKKIEEIAIIGMSGAFPGAKDIQQLWDLLQQKREGISTFDREELLAAGETLDNIENPAYVPRGGFLDDVELFDHQFFSMTPREALATDPQHRHFLTHSWLALEDAGYDPANLDCPVGVFAGGGAPEYWFLQRRSSASGGLDDFQTMIGNDKDFLATRVSYKLNLKGPSLSIQSACSTSLAAVGVACQNLLTYTCDVAIAGGTSITALRKRGYFYYEGMIYSRAGRCRPFDREADGTIFSEGVGAVCLKRLSEAISDGDYIYAVIKAVAINNDGSEKIGYTAPSISGQSEVIELAQALAGVAPEEIGYVETHGSATSLGDAIEIEALTKAFRSKTDKNGFCYLGALKANIGHLDAAAGIAALIKAALVVNQGKIPPLANFNAPNPQLKLDSSPFLINKETVDWPTGDGRRICGISSFGVGGTNVHLILEGPPARDASGIESPPLLISAKSRASLDATKEALAAFLSGNPGVAVGDAIKKVTRPSHDFAYRWGSPAMPRGNLVESLKKAAPASQPMDSAECVFAFPGQGAQFSGMAKAYYGKLRVFTKWIDEGIAIAKGLGLDGIGKYLLEDSLESEIAETAITQPLLFIIEYALARELMDRGLHPVAVAGHSVGEYAAAAISGVMSFEDGVKLVERRGFWMQRAPRGGMVAVSMTAAEAVPYLSDGIRISLYNTDRQVVLAGVPEAVDQLERRLAAEGKTFARLKTSHAFHSPLMDDILAPFKEVVAQARFGSAEIPFLSNINGHWVSDPMDWVEYWTEQLKQPVRFDRCIHALRKIPAAQILEIGPGKVLTSFFRSDSAPHREPIPILPNAASDHGYFESCLIRCWEEGLSVKWDRPRTAPDALVLFAGYQFDRKPFWPALEAQAIGTHGDHRLGDSLSPPRPEEAVIPSPAVEKADPELAPRGGGPLGGAQPSGDLRTDIRRIWRSVLGNEPASDDASFFLSGGDSFAGIQMIERLRKELGFTMLVQDLMSYPSVSTLVSFVSKGPSEAMAQLDPFLMPIQATGSRQPLFFVAGAHENRYFDPALGNSYQEDFFRYFGNMIANLGEEHTLYAFKPKGLAMGEHLHTSVEVMASRYIESMMRVQPDGPYWIGGECVGGIVAYEMARQLAAANQEVGALILLDTPRPSAWNSLQEGLMYYGHLASKAVKSGFRTMKTDGLMALVKLVRSKLLIARCVLFPVGRKARELNRALNGSRWYQRTLFSYRPKGELTGPVALLMNRKWNRQRYMQDWQRELGPKLSFYEIPGDHETRLIKSGPMVGEIIRRIIDGQA